LFITRKERVRTVKQNLTKAIIAQAATYVASTRSIVASKEFARGLDEVRKGLPFNADHDDWDYERGRCFGFIAPPDMPLRIGRRLNPKALILAHTAFNRKFLI
jgi:hypothetical protein